MKTQKFTIMLASILVLCTGLKAQGEPEQISNTRQASCQLRVSMYGEIIPLTPEIIKNLLWSFPVSEKAAREVLQKPDLNIAQTIKIHNFTRLSGTDKEDKEIEDIDAKRSLSEYRALKRMGMISDKQMSREETERLAFERMLLNREREPHPPYKVSTDYNEKPYARRQTILFQLEVALPKHAKPAAVEFLNAVIENFEKVLWDVFVDFKNELDAQLLPAHKQYSRARQQYNEAIGKTETLEDKKIKEQLKQVVDLSEFNPEMTLEDALDIMKSSVDTPLTVVALWRDLTENADVTPTTAINMDPISGIRLGRALELLLKSISLGYADLDYRIDKGVITIATAEALPPEEEKIHRELVTEDSLEQLQERKYELQRRKEDLQIEMRLLGKRHDAIGHEMHRIQEQVNHKIKEDSVCKELHNIVGLYHDMIQENQPGSMERMELNEKLARARIELAKRKEQLSEAAGGQQIAEFNKKLSTMRIDRDVKNAEFFEIEKILDKIEKKIKSGSENRHRFRKIQKAQRALEKTEHRLNQLKTWAESIPPPSVITIGRD